MITVTHHSGPTGRPATQVSVDIATSTLTSARQIARTVREAIVDCLQLNRHQPGLIRVNVLRIEPGPTQPSSL
jgi:23S rRNA G2445 N2-methylase RlmL